MDDDLFINDEPDLTERGKGEYFVFDFSAYRDTLTLTAVDGEISPLNFRAEPWHRIGKPGSVELDSWRFN